MPFIWRCGSGGVPTCKSISSRRNIVGVFLISLLNGISYGLLLFMLCRGLTLIFGMMGVLNFAHASFYMLGAYFAHQISRHIGFWPALFLAPLLVGGVGAV